MTLVAGIDSSTQSCKIVICDADTGVIRRSGNAAHPPGTEIHPDRWWEALGAASAAAGGLADVAAVAVAAQQHGMVCLDETGGVIRDALLWNDTRSAAAARALIDDLGGPTAWAEAVGVVPVASITAAKLRWLADAEPHHVDATAAVCLPHDWLTWRLSGSRDITTVTTDRSDASGTGYYSAATNSYRPDLLELATRGRTPAVPSVLGPDAVAAHTVTGAILGAGAGDNAAAALGLQTRLGDAVVSLGTSGVVCAVTNHPPHDPSGLVAGFADATGAHLPLVCTLNGAPVLAATATLLGVDLDEFAALALAAEPGAGGLTLIPFLAGERSPNLPDATGTLTGITLTNLTPANIARAAVEGLLASLVYCRERIEDHHIAVDRVVLTGGGARSAAVAAIAPALFGGEVTVAGDAEYVALGAARQAAWALTGELPTWPSATTVISADPTPQVLERYRDALQTVIDHGR